MTTINFFEFSENEPKQQKKADKQEELFPTYPPSFRKADDYLKNQGKSEYTTPLFSGEKSND